MSGDQAGTYGSQSPLAGRDVIQTNINKPSYPLNVDPEYYDQLRDEIRHLKGNNSDLAALAAELEGISKQNETKARENADIAFQYRQFAQDLEDEIDRLNKRPVISPEVHRDGLLKAGAAALVVGAIIGWLLFHNGSPSEPSSAKSSPPSTIIRTAPGPTVTKTVQAVVPNLVSEPVQMDCNSGQYVAGLGIFSGPNAERDVLAYRDSTRSREVRRKVSLSILIQITTIHDSCAKVADLNYNGYVLWAGPFDDEISAATFCKEMSWLRSDCVPERMSN